MAGSSRRTTATSTAGAVPTTVPDTRVPSASRTLTVRGAVDDVGVGDDESVGVVDDARSEPDLGVDAHDRRCDRGCDGRHGLDLPVGDGVLVHDGRRHRHVLGDLGLLVGRGDVGVDARGRGGRVGAAVSVESEPESDACGEERDAHRRCLRRYVRVRRGCRLVSGAREAGGGGRRGRGRRPVWRRGARQWRCGRTARRCGWRDGGVQAPGRTAAGGAGGTGGLGRAIGIGAVTGNSHGRASGLAAVVQTNHRRDRRGGSGGTGGRFGAGGAGGTRTGVGGGRARRAQDHRRVHRSWGAGGPSMADVASRSRVYSCWSLRT